MPATPTPPDAARINAHAQLEDMLRRYGLQWTLRSLSEIAIYRRDREDVLGSRVTAVNWDVASRAIDLTADRLRTLDLGA